MDPADVVRALFEAAVAGEDAAAFADGALAEHLRFEHDLGRRLESAARTLEVHRLREVAVDGDTATVELDIEARVAWKSPVSEDWEPTSSRARGLARLVRRDGRWLVVDLPTSSGGSSLDGWRQLEPGRRDGHLDLDVQVHTSRSADDFYLRLRNAGEQPLTPDDVLLERRAFGVLPVRLRLPFVVRPTLATGDVYAFRFQWKLPLRLGRASIGVEARDDAGGVHTTTVDVARPPRPWAIAVMSGWPVRVFELAAVGFGIWALLPSWIVSSFLPGLALAGAGVQRAAVIAALVRSRGRGAGIAVLGAIAAGEWGVGAWLVLRAFPSFDGVIILASTLFLLVPALRRKRR